MIGTSEKCASGLRAAEQSKGIAEQALSKGKHFRPQKFALTVPTSDPGAFFVHNQTSTHRSSNRDR
jgi:hypothetical protein